MAHRFGGPWTEQKLGVLRKYLEAYLKIFHGNPRAQFFTTHYVDAFAGCGHRTLQPAMGAARDLFDGEVAPFLQGSASIALELEPSFDHYLFMEVDAGRRVQLEALVRESERSCRVLPEEANAALRTWVEGMDWKKNRAVVFLDPYGMQVDWATVEVLAATDAVDLWLLFPLGQAVHRVLASGGPLPEWEARLDRFFGTRSWREEFYEAPVQADLFGATQAPERAGGWQRIEAFVLRRLREVFSGVAPQPGRLYNSTFETPLYLLFFAAANPKGARPAVKIAKDLLDQL